jgi:hypothetical protein
MANLHRELRKTIGGQNAYASNRSFLEFISDSLRDIGIENEATLPHFDNPNEEAAVKELLQVRERLLQMQDLAFNVRAHESILDRAHNGEVDLSLQELKYHQDFISTNKEKVKEYVEASKTPVELINEKIKFLNGLFYKLTPSPWCPDQTPRPALYPMIQGIVSHLEIEKNRILSESVVLNEDISGFSDDFFGICWRPIQQSLVGAKRSFARNGRETFPHSCSLQVSIF